MKMTITGIWNLRMKRFESDDEGQLFMYWNKSQAKGKLTELGKYFPDTNEIFRILMPISIGRENNNQIINAIYVDATASQQKE